VPVSIGNSAVTEPNQAPTEKSSTTRRRIRRVVVFLHYP
jgi:hypothetical protein